MLLGWCVKTMQWELYCETDDSDNHNLQSRWRNLQLSIATETHRLSTTNCKGKNSNCKIVLTVP